MASIQNIEIVYNENSHSCLRYDGKEFKIDNCESLDIVDLKELISSIETMIGFVE